MFFVAGNWSSGFYPVSILLTNKRLLVERIFKEKKPKGFIEIEIPFHFHLMSKKIMKLANITPLESYDQSPENMVINGSLMTVNLGSIIAVKVPEHNKDKSAYKVEILRNRGDNISCYFKSATTSKMFYLLMIDMIDRLINPIRDSVHSAKRKRIPDEVKIKIGRAHV